MTLSIELPTDIFSLYAGIAAATVMPATPATRQGWKHNIQTDLADLFQMYFLPPRP